ncbi:MAG TPA: carboxypeptidase-like regulatory domain-containing protein, partial [Vicinamibacteria bacterium]|nr:carboxypeptidase-like regulatory domain-containing protein [Vicinamibacteria bacterium]
MHALAALLLLAGGFVFGEPLQGRLSGIVLDPSGAVVPGASVALRHADTVLGSVKTDAEGRFLFEQVAPGKYEVEVRLDGFKAAHVRASVGKGSSPPLSIPLEVAPVAEEVTVGEGGLSTHPGENRDAATVDRKLLDGLPVFDQDVISTLSGFLDPGAIGSDGVSLVVDGAEANRVLVSPSAIQEVRINQNPYSAEYYRQGRGRIEIVTKKEEPEYHGELNVLFRDSSLNARSPFAPQKAPEQRRVYEGNLSGPIGQSKTTTFLLTLDRQEEDLQSIVVAAGPGGAIRANVATPQR